MTSSGADLSGRVALVTGAAGGIGRASARALAAAGALVVAADIDLRGVEETAGLIESDGGRAWARRADMTDPADVTDLIRFALDHGGRLDCAHNNAGIEGPIGPVHEYPEDAWERVLAINLTAVWRCMKHEIDVMLRQGSGVIVNTASISGMTGFPPLLPAYVASKFGVTGLTRAAARHYAASNIRINAVAPGSIETPMLDRIGDDAARLGVSMVAENPSGRRGQPVEVGAAVVWLCSDEASFVNGHLLVVDGGFMA
jgi:NAD(P)-dependent dehydrogenase (short-subunit alcohol dehydrogenase family)